MANVTASRAALFESAKKILADEARKQSRPGYSSKLADVLAAVNFKADLRALVSKFDPARGELRARVLWWAKHYGDAERMLDRSVTGAKFGSISTEEAAADDGAPEWSADYDGDDLGASPEAHDDLSRGEVLVERQGCYGADPAWQLRHYPRCIGRPMNAKDYEREWRAPVVRPRVLTRRRSRLQAPWLDLLERCGYPSDASPSTLAAPSHTSGAVLAKKYLAGWRAARKAYEPRAYATWNKASRIWPKGNRQPFSVDNSPAPESSLQTARATARYLALEYSWPRDPTNWELDLGVWCEDHRGPVGWWPADPQRWHPLPTLRPEHRMAVKWQQAERQLRSVNCSAVMAYWLRTCGPMFALTDRTVPARRPTAQERAYARQRPKRPADYAWTGTAQNVGYWATVWRKATCSGKQVETAVV